MTQAVRALLVIVMLLGIATSLIGLMGMRRRSGASGSGLYEGAELLVAVALGTTGAAFIAWLFLT